MRLPREEWRITALFSNCDLDRVDEAGMLAPLSGLALYYRELAYIAFSAQWNRRCNGSRYEDNVLTFCCKALAGDQWVIKNRGC